VVRVPAAATALATHCSTNPQAIRQHSSAWQAARVEVNQEREAKKRAEEDLAGEVVERVVAETDVKPTPEA
jgi:starvation-inducible outer membrane lipoprotein